MTNSFLTSLQQFATRCREKFNPLAETFFKESAHPTHWILWIAFAFVILFVIWAKFAVLDEVTVAQGKIIPSSQVQIIQNLEGGIIKDLVVHEGDIVQKGQVLAYIDNARFNSNYRESLMKEFALTVKIDRLAAEAEKKPFIVSAELKNALPDLVKSEQKSYEIDQAQLQRMQESYQLANKELQMTKPLVAEGAASEVEVLRLERQNNELQNQVDALNTRTLAELNAAKADFAALKEANVGLKDRLDRTVVRSPVKGVVKQIKISTEGGVAQPGMEIMQIVPLEDNLLVEAQVRPADIGFIHPGLEATVKLSAYDFSIYGGIEGKVEQIGADTITNDKGESFYIIKVRTQKNYLGTKDKPLYIIPGMIATVDILTGKKSVLQYLLKPILKARERALRER